MKELIGYCCLCNKEVYCLNGFFNGIVDKNQLFCNECYTSKD
jgi:hypothetical protein